MARPKTGQTPVKTFRPPVPLWDEVMKYVKAEERPYADVVIEALHDWLRKKDREQERLRRERDLLLTTFDPSEFGRPDNPVFTEPAEDFSVRDELTGMPERPVSSEETST